MSDIKIIALTKGYACLIDAEDFDKVMAVAKRWHASTQGSGIYATTKIRIGGKQRHQSIHRVVMDAPSEMLVDHINHDTLDNRKANLRIVTKQQNQCNVLPRKGNWSKYKGVCYNTRVNRWVAYINHLGKREYLGYFNNEMDAAMAYDKASIRLHGEFGYRNMDRAA